MVVSINSEVCSSFATSPYLLIMQKYNSIVHYYTPMLQMTKKYLILSKIRFRNFLIII